MAKVNQNETALDKCYGKDFETRLDRETNEDFSVVEFLFYEIINRDTHGKITETKDIISKKYTVTELPDKIKTQLIVHGLLAKMGDSLASFKGETIQKCVNQLDGMWTDLKDGKWFGRKVKSERVQKVTAEDIKAKLPEGMTEESAIALMKAMGLFKG